MAWCTKADDNPLECPAGAIPASHRPYSETVAWSAVHGLSMLIINGPLAGAAPAELDRMLTVSAT